MLLKPLSRAAGRRRSDPRADPRQRREQRRPGQRAASSRRARSCRRRCCVRPTARRGSSRAASATSRHTAPARAWATLLSSRRSARSSAGPRAGAACCTGSVKTNIGHAEAASGIAGLIKAVLCLEHRRDSAQPALHGAEPAHPVGSAAARRCAKAQPWPEEFTPAFAGVNSFGVTGTNAHVVLEEAPARPPRDRAATRPAGYGCCRSARRAPQALRALAERWVTLLEAT